MLIELNTDGVYAIITINKIPHLAFHQDKLEGFQSYIYAKNWYAVILYLAGGQTITVEYGSREMWEEVLKILASINDE